MDKAKAKRMFPLLCGLIAVALACIVVFGVI